MASYFDEPDACDDGAFIEIRFDDILPANHPANLIKKFVSTIDLSSFMKKYQVGHGQVGRPPKGIRMVLGVLLYAIYCRIYSAHKIDKATYSYSDFWIFTHKNRISHDKISQFLNFHEEEITNIFLETILLADKNKLLDFDALYQDGFLIKANASKKKNRTLKSLNEREAKISKGLYVAIEKLQDNEEDKELKKDKGDLENKLKKISELKDELNNRINKRLEGKRPDKVDKDKASINLTDKDSSLMKMKNKSHSNAYLQINATDSKADIIIGSVVEGHYDESHNAVRLFNESNQNCKNIGKYEKVCFDSGFNTLGTCVGFESLEVEVIAPTKEYENETRNPDDHKDKIKFDYDEKKQEVICSEGTVLYKKSHYLDERRGILFYIFNNIEACKRCRRIKECTTSKEGYRKVKIDSRSPVQKRALEIYKSKEGQKIYKKRSHAAETHQGDLIHNGKFDRFLRRGIGKVRIESQLNNIVWNLRRIFNTTGRNIIWAS